VRQNWTLCCTAHRPSARLLRAFEAAAFPSWARWFAAARPEHVLLARTQSGSIAGTLLLEGPGADSVFTPMLGPAAATISSGGVAPSLHGQGIGTALVVRASQILSQADVRACHIGWTTRESFYRRAGYQPWRRYAMYSSPPDCPCGHRPSRPTFRAPNVIRLPAAHQLPGKPEPP